MRKPILSRAGLERLVTVANQRADEKERAENATRRKLENLVLAVYGEARYQNERTYDGAMLLIGQLKSDASSQEGRRDDRVALIQDENRRLWDLVRELTGVKGKKTVTTEQPIDTADDYCVRHGCSRRNCGCDLRP